MIKYGALIWDPKGVISGSTFSPEFCKLQEELKKYMNLKLVHTNCGYDYGGAVNCYATWFINKEKEFDQGILVYDGNFLFDGMANHALYAINYGGATCNHHTHHLIDDSIDGYEVGKGEAFIAKLLYKLYTRFVYDVSYPSDGCTLGEKRAHIDRLKEYF